MKILKIKVWKRRSLLEIIIFMFHVKKWGELPPVLHLLSLVEQSQGFSEPQVLSNHCKKKVLIGTMGRCTCFFG